MTKRQNLISLYQRKGYSQAPLGFSLCPSLYQIFKEKTCSDNVAEYFGFPERGLQDLILPETDRSIFRKYYDFELLPNTYIDEWGIAHEPGSKASRHMTRMRHPLAKIDSIEQLREYPFPDYSKARTDHLKKQAHDIHNQGLAASAFMEMTVWETSWYMRSMEDLLVDMMMEDEKAEYILDKVTDNACIRASAFAEAGVDILNIGDDIGMQNTIMMSLELFRTWLKPRLQKVIRSAKEANPQIIVKYHSCGYVKPFINDLIEMGVDVLNPVQPECMSFREIHSEFGDRLSFHGTIGTQTTMPFGSPEDVKREVRRNLEIAGAKGGLFCAPTHLLEPEVPWENILAYAEACRDF